MKKSRHAVGECYKTLNIHDPHEQHVWADDDLPWWVRALYGLAILACFAAITIFGLLL